MHELDKLLQHSGLKDLGVDETLLHYGVKGMKWDKQKAEEEQEKSDLKKIKKELSNRIVAKLKAAKKAPGKAVKNAKKKITRAAKFAKEHPIQTAKNVTGITKRESKERVEGARLMKLEERDNPEVAAVVKQIMKLQREVNDEKKEAWKNVPKIPKLLKKAAIQKTKDKLGITEKESKSRKQKTVTDRLDRNDPKVKKTTSVRAPQRSTVYKPRTNGRPKNLNDLVSLKFDRNSSNKASKKRQSRTLPM